MNVLIGGALALVSAVLVYFLHSILKAEFLAIVVLVVSIFLVTLDQSRKYYYVIGLISFPVFTAISVAISKDQSLYPIVIFYEAVNVAMIFFGSYLGTKIRSWIQLFNAGKQVSK